ncbi:hypothetical protein J6590_014875 [Homalodisca vitripennis]|nr:hypothetical protein J6590_014875 [Homalodisca vitripennis]
MCAVRETILLERQVPSGGTLVFSHDKEAKAAFDCPRCGKAYKWKTNLTRHLRLECGVEPKFGCVLCPFKTKHKGSLLKHVAIMHSSTMEDVA